VLPTAGHTPGHSSFLIADAGQEAVIPGDAAHCPIELLDPGLQWLGDDDRDQAVRVRRALARRLADEGALVVGPAHGRDVPFSPTDLVLKQATLIGSRSARIEYYGRGLKFPEDNADRLTWHDMISRHYTLDQVNDAFDSMAGWQEIKPVIDLASAP
jgi:glyoxylase-like metal-dependent hydrolase (beta-lactamase superfamily II)